MYKLPLDCNDASLHRFDGSFLAQGPTRWFPELFFVWSSSSFFFLPPAQRPYSACQ